MLFTDAIVLIDETKARTAYKLGLWGNALESKSFELSRTKATYMECNFSNRRQKVKT